jgi:SDR family mycofactocin-dependent oxidoreductase
MSGRVEGKVALVTGAARGQGRAHAVRLAEEGADIIAIDICAPLRAVPYPAATPEDLAETVRLVESTGRRIVHSIVDIRDAAALDQAIGSAVQELGRLDIVVANAGIVIIAPWDEVTPEIWEETIGVNLTGTWNTVQAAVPHVVATGGGSVILVSSAAGVKAMPFLAPYVASKWAITGLTRTLAHELAKDHVRVNSLHPGGVDTPMGDENGTAAFGPALEANPGVGGMLITSHPAPMTQPEDQANAVLFLASDESRFITSLAMVVDGGVTTY